MVGSGYSAWEALIVGLAVLATLPVLQLLSLGYLLEVSGRTAAAPAKCGPHLSAFVSGAIGSVALAVWLLLLVPRLTASLWQDVQLIDPTSPAVGILRFVTVVTCASDRGSYRCRSLAPRRTVATFSLAEADLFSQGSCLGRGCFPSEAKFAWLPQELTIGVFSRFGS